MKCPFKLGQKVVCIKNDMWVTSSSGTPSEGPKYGDVLTIDGFSVQGEWVGLRFVEFKRFTSKGEEYSYNYTRFRPLDEKRTDTGMAILRGILDDVNAGKDVKIKEDA